MREELSCQVAYWDRVAGEKRFSHPLRGRMLHARLVPDPLVLDYGCGWGRVLDGLRDLGCRRLIGVDPSRAMVERGKREHPGLDLRVQEGDSLPFGTDTFDLVLLFAVLTCVPTDSGQRRIAAEAARVLRPGGLLYVSDYLLQSDRRNLERYAAGEKKFGCRGVFELAEGVVLRHHARPWLDGLLAGFERLEWDEFEVETMNGHRARAFQALCRKPSAGPKGLAGPAGPAIFKT